MKNKNIDDGRKMKFSKLSVPERALEKRLGYIKHAVIEKLGLELQTGLNEVKINWTEHELT